MFFGCDASQCRDSFFKWSLKVWSSVLNMWVEVVFKVEHNKEFRYGSILCWVNVVLRKPIAVRGLLFFIYFEDKLKSECLCVYHRQVVSNWGSCWACVFVLSDLVKVCFRLGFSILLRYCWRKFLPVPSCSASGGGSYCTWTYCSPHLWGGVCAASLCQVLVS